MKIKLDPHGFPPLRAHETDAGMDLRAERDAEVYPHSHELFFTGVHVQLPKGTCGLLVSKSGLNVRHGLTSTGLIDEGYTGEIVVKLDNDTDFPYYIHRGDKISQLVVVPVLYEKVELVDELDGDTERGDNGFGSTGR